MILTVRNFNAYRSYRNPPASSSNDKCLHNLEIHSRTDPIDVRLVTSNGVTNIKQERIPLNNDSINDPLVLNTGNKVDIEDEDIKKTDDNNESDDDSMEERRKSRTAKRRSRFRYESPNNADKNDEKLHKELKERKLIANILLRQSNPDEKRCRRDFDCAQNTDECKYKVFCHLVLYNQKKVFSFIFTFFRFSKCTISNIKSTL